MRLTIALVGLMLIAVGPAALWSPDFAARAFGVPFEASHSKIYLLAMASRDVALGSWLLVMLFLRANRQLLGASLLSLAIVPLFDAANIAINVGLHERLSLFVHCSSFVVLVFLGVWLCRKRSW